MPNQNEEEQVYFEYPERAEAIDNSQEFEEVEELPENREKREVGNLGESIHREKRRANYDSNPNLDVDVNVNIKAPQKDFKANVDVNVNINAGRFLSKYHVARGMPRGTAIENEHPEIYETFHTEPLNLKMDHFERGMRE
ncbi:hypothetical protein SK128_002797 [Halocaridina rubra]|uniref:Uncharacterized protein n=1 Tax=Halocaridina rubra TaxID=373956 RepID=A0AAN9AEY5_HALRR